MSQLIANLHNKWLELDPGIRAALSFSVAVLVGTVIALGKSFGWTMPTDLASAWAEIVAFATVAAPVLAVLVAQLVRSQIAPAVVQWFLATFGYAPTEKIARSSMAPTLLIGTWVRA